jgi:hypothetical protein
MKRASYPYQQNMLGEDQGKKENLALPGCGYHHCTDLLPFLATLSCCVTAAQRPSGSSCSKTLPLI